MVDLEVLQSFIAESAGPVLEQDRILQVQLATEEALVNIFNHAYPQELKGNVTVVCKVMGSRGFEVEIMDHGVAFDMLGAKDPDLESPIEDRPIGGLGLFFIRQMTDEIEYCRKDGRNILRFLFKAR